MSGAIDRVLREYDAENDIEGEGKVTWSDWIMADAINDLQEENSQLKERIKALEFSVAAINNRLVRM